MKVSFKVGLGLTVWKKTTTKLIGQRIMIEEKADMLHGIQ